MTFISGQSNSKLKLQIQISDERHTSLESTAGYPATQGVSMTRYFFVENTCFSAPKFYVYAITRLERQFCHAGFGPCPLQSMATLFTIPNTRLHMQTTPLISIASAHPKTKFSHHLPSPRLPRYLSPHSQLHATKLAFHTEVC